MQGALGFESAAACATSAVRSAVSDRGGEASRGRECTLAGAKKVVEFVVPGTPVGKGRPKVASRGGKFAQLYTPEKTANYEGLVAHSGHAAMAGRPLIEGAVFVNLDIRLPVPSSWSNRKRLMALDGKVHPTKKPDIDNVEKAIFDGLNGVVWKDDVQVVSVQKQKRYSNVPGVDVLIREIGPGG
ncbi:RusA family crossover junction endodeoxyribonuclease [Methyloversatilis sp. XJ19-49]|uniref:RusA family crossover junction endodeoxyribonuclease n=1 Tax=Methyloversatilis sp. XJ19-49 TaxID=2963429 RepID=UPI00211C4003|nr:RusA family crossover junction endodeoxyribonuclease [Methyloversatilis sp. XJ19-49]MCQ9378822.1 RusA family crossover junction endodeoxyribonuclease [Methyloversatilis sp. XJ19-49]